MISLEYECDKLVQKIDDPPVRFIARPRSSAKAGRSARSLQYQQGVWADIAYRSVRLDAGPKAKGLQSRIRRRAARNRPLSERQKSANTTPSRVRAPVVHVFGHQQNSMGARSCAESVSCGARFKIGMMNLGYNIRRLVQL